jgi:tripartite-type tricarboxylate transporter receptor subunit TctC
MRHEVSPSAAYFGFTSFLALLVFAEGLCFLYIASHGVRRPLPSSTKHLAEAGTVDATVPMNTRAPKPPINAAQMANDFILSSFGPCRGAFPQSGMARLLQTANAIKHRYGRVCERHMNIWACGPRRLPNDRTPLSRTSKISVVLRSDPRSCISKFIEGHIVKLPRRQFLHLAAGAAALPAISRIGWAQSYPSRPVRIIVGFAAGGLADIPARLTGQWLSERLGQPFVVENRTGAGGTLAAETVAHARGDGYTLLVVDAPDAINATLYKKLNFSFVSDIAPVATFIRQPLVMVVNPSVPAKSVAEFIAYAKAHPGRLSMASAGVGSVPHVSGELFKMMAGVDMIHVPYRGGAPAMTDLLGGQVQVMFLAPVFSIEYIRTGSLRPLAVTSAMRWEDLPDVPTVGEFLPGYEASTWVGLGAPKNTPADIIDKLNREINAALANPKINAELAHLGGGAFASSPADFGKLIAEEIEKWAKVIKFAGVKAD